MHKDWGHYILMESYTPCDVSPHLGEEYVKVQYWMEGYYTPKCHT
jgi:hypothetical protein